MDCSIVSLAWKPSITSYTRQYISTRQLLEIPQVVDIKAFFDWKSHSRTSKSWISSPLRHVGVHLVSRHWRWSWAIKSITTSAPSYLLFDRLLPSQYVIVFVDVLHNHSIQLSTRHLYLGALYIFFADPINDWRVGASSHESPSASFFNFLLWSNFPET